MEAVFLKFIDLYIWVFANHLLNMTWRSIVSKVSIVWKSIFHILFCTIDKPNHKAVRSHFPPCHVTRRRTEEAAFFAQNERYEQDVNYTVIYKVFHKKWTVRGLWKHVNRSFWKFVCRDYIKYWHLSLWLYRN